MRAVYNSGVTFLGTTHSQIVYDPLGRMTDKQADGQAVFANASFAAAQGQPAQPHAMKSAETAEGVFPPESQTITYTGFDKVKTISEGGNTLAYTYGYDQQRIRMVENVGDITRTKDYVGVCEYIAEDDGENTTEKTLTYLVGPYGVFAVVEQQNSEESIHYILKDHLGSWTTITDAEGNVEQELSFDAWGNLRNPATWSGGFSGAPMFDRGFTGHEHMTAFGLINMNGRCYDPMTSSFLSVDAYVQDPTSAQAFNRYAYCAHNPLRYTDPTGWVYGTKPPGAPNLNTGGHTQYFSDDPNDMLWGRSVHPCDNGSSGYVNGTAVTSTGYTEGNKGLYGSNYTVDRQGYMKKVGSNDVTYDILYTQDSWNSGVKDIFVEIPIGVLAGKQTASGLGTDGIVYTFDMYTIKGDTKSTELFEFLADNTDVEWSQTFVGNFKNETSVLSTSHVENTEAGQAYLLHNGWTIRAHNHSHPYNNTPSPNDRKWATAVHNKYPNALLNIYYKGIYYEYNKEGLIYIKIDSNIHDTEILFDTLNKNKI